MTELLSLGFSLAAGSTLASLHFVGLWLTVRQIPSSPAPALLMLGSSLGRTVVTVGGFFVLASVDLRQLPPCLVAFVFTRLTLQWRLGKPAAHCLSAGEKRCN